MKIGFQQWLQFLVSLLIVIRTQSVLVVNITYVPSAVPKGGVCLDGTAPAYHFDKGSGSGINNWVVHIEGGGWCHNLDTCRNYYMGRFGSSAKMETQYNFTGSLSNDPLENPDLYNWNRIRVRYCDGSSFTGDVEAVDPATNMHFRGARVFRAVIEDLLEKGMKNATNALLSGCSAGGLASIHNCDRFKSLLPTSTNVKCMTDAGFFLNEKDITGAPHIEDYYNDIVTLHGSALPEYCTSKMKPSLCFFPQNIVQGIKTPLFIINSAYDPWQISNVLVPNTSDPQDSWHDCKASYLRQCNANQIKTLEGFGSQFVETVKGLGPSSSRGYFISSDFIHCFAGNTHAGPRKTWFGSAAQKLKNKTMAEAVIDWFYDRSPFQEVDCLYSHFNGTCGSPVKPVSA